MKKTNQRKRSNYRAGVLGSRSRLRVLLIVGCLSALLIAFLLIIHWHNQSHPKAVSVKEPAGQTTQANSANTNSSTKTSTTQSSPAPNNAAGSTTPPNAPSGTFVSNHAAAQDSQELSTCTTTPGASCSISFVNGNLTKTLESKQTDASGAVSWSWSPQSLYLGSGQWQISATATLNGQSVSTKDTKVLQVQ